MYQSIKDICAYYAIAANFNGRPARGLSNAPLISAVHNPFAVENLLAKILVILIVAVIITTGLRLNDDFEYAYQNITVNMISIVQFFACQMLIIFNFLVFSWRILLVMRYSPAPACDDKDLPSCTVVVPAYNEGKQVLHTLRSVAKSDYPADKLQIIAIDDGSIDDTWRWIESAADEFPDRIETIKMPENGGKRYALFAGFLAGTGSVMVTLDSDSLIDSKALRRLVSPLVHDKSVGAVAGNVRVLNRDKGLIPKMLDVSFAFSFDFIRASQSMIGTVFCTPGALSAYRTEPLMRNLREWMNQTFFGRPCTIGEDRAMTNFIIRDGYKVLFQSDAVVYTDVPVRYDKLCRMFLRWARSNVREILVMARFIFTKFRTFGSAGARVNFAASCVNLFAWMFILPVAMFHFVGYPIFFLSQTLFWAVCLASLPAIFYVIRHKSTDAVWAYAYSIFWLTALWWITPYALLTARNGNWLTRDLPFSPSPKDNASKNRSLAAA
jgi:hyaluronan synthase